MVGSEQSKRTVSNVGAIYVNVANLRFTEFDKLDVTDAIASRLKQERLMCE